MKARFDSMNELIYRLTAALRHATQLELQMGHGINTLDTSMMLNEDMKQARLALARLNDIATKKETADG
jgi:hypothetical protein